MITSLLAFLALGVAVFIALCAFLYVRQESFIFYPRPNDPALAKHWHSDRVEIPSGGTMLEGWWTENPNASNATIILYFGGNAEDVLHTARMSALIDARRMLVVNYRGYGGSIGRPSQSALFEDALAIYDYAIGSAGAKPDHIVVMGRSLGSGVATMLASKRSVRGAILITPYDSIAAVAAHHYSLFPTRLLLKHPFPSSDLAQHAQAPALIIAAEHDRIIPPTHAKRLHAAWAGPKKIHILDSVGHNDVEQHPNYYHLINEFLTNGNPAG